MKVKLDTGIMEDTQIRHLEREEQKRQKRRESMAQPPRPAGLDYTLILIIVFLIGFGLIMLYSTTYYAYGTDYLEKQAIFGILSLFIMLVMALIDYHIYVKAAPLLLFASWILMLLVRFSPLGITRYGARRWLKVPVIEQLQPSEITKIAVILIGPYLIVRMGKKFQQYTGMVTVFLVSLLTAVGTFVLTDHLSAAVIMVGIAYMVIFVASKKSKLLGFLAVFGIAAAYVGARLLAVALENSDSFRLQRILVWNNPEKYMDEGGYQILQGLYAIGSGGFFGKGLGNSTQKLGFIPEAQNDMILAIIGEELGVFGIVMLLFLFALLLYRLLFIASNAPDQAGGLLVTGVFAHVSLQVILNLCVLLNVIPTTGITLPFISYGGSALVFLMMEMGMAMSVARSTRKKIAGEFESLRL